MKLLFLSTLIILIIGFTLPAYSDTISLRNQETFEGKIIKETDNEVLIDVGVGVISFDKSQIIEIKKEKKESPAPQKTSSLKLKKGEKLPSTYLDYLFALLRDVQEKRREAVQLKRECNELYEQFNAYQDLYAAYSKMLVDLDRGAHEQHAVGNVKDYNALIVQLNTVRAKRFHVVGEARQTFEERVKREGKLHDVVRTLFNLHFDFNEQYLQVKKEHIAPSDAYYYKELEKEAKSLVNDFKPIYIDYVEKNKNPVITVLLNGALDASFIVDPDAPVTLLSQEIAHTLQVGNTIPLGVIDGAQIGIPFKEAEPVFINSMRTQELQRDNVTALAVKVNALPNDKIDGILGASFFKSCIVQKDKEKKQFMLYEFVLQ